MQSCMQSCIQSIDWIQSHRYFSGNPELADHAQILNTLLRLLSAYGEISIEIGHFSVPFHVEIPANPIKFRSKITILN
jgi:hypothetical protein